MITKFKKIFISIILCSALLTLSGCSLLYSSEKNNENIKEESKEDVVVHRDHIYGVSQPYPFLTTEEEVFNDLLEYSKTNVKGKVIFDNLDKISFYDQKLLANNKDATDFVYGYVTNGKPDIVYGSYIPTGKQEFSYGETVTLKRKYPYYVQWDRRWGYDRLGGVNIAIGGCGPTTVAMALGGMLNNEKITPNVISEIADKQGFFTRYGISWSFFNYIANYYGLKSKVVYINEDSINKVLQKNQPIIASVVPGKFTTVGHIVLIVGRDENGDYIINDPNSLNRTLKKWSFEELKPELKAMWTFEK